MLNVTITLAARLSPADAIVAFQRLSQDQQLTIVAANMHADQGAHVGAMTSGGGLFAAQQASACVSGAGVALTDADAAADLAGTPRPDHPTAQTTAAQNSEPASPTRAPRSTKPRALKNDGSEGAATPQVGKSETASAPAETPKAPAEPAASTTAAQAAPSETKASDGAAVPASVSHADNPETGVEVPSVDALRALVVAKIKEGHRTVLSGLLKKHGGEDCQSVSAIPAPNREAFRLEVAALEAPAP